LNLIFGTGAGGILGFIGASMRPHDGAQTFLFGASCY